MRYNLILLLLFSTLSCDLDDYHNLGHFPNRLSAEQEVLEHLLDEYYKLDEGYYKVTYQFPEANEELKYAVWYNKDLCELGVEIDVYSGMLCTWTGVDQSVLRTLIAQKRGIQKAKLSKWLIHPKEGRC